MQDYDQDREDVIGGGIDLVKAKKVLKAEDKFDKELKKEQKKTQKRLLKESKHSNDKRNAGAAKLVRFSSYLCIFHPKYFYYIFFVSDLLWLTYCEKKMF